MEGILSRLLENLVCRVDRPMALRFLLQPAMAIIFGIRDRLRFAREGLVVRPTSEATAKSTPMTSTSASSKLRSATNSAAGILRYPVQLADLSG